MFDQQGVETHAANLERVHGRISTTILEFMARVRLSVIMEFHGEELRRFVDNRHPGAPGSADRIMRLMRKKGVIEYELVSRRKSLYKLLR